MSQRHPVWVAENHVNPCNRVFRVPVYCIHSLAGEGNGWSQIIGQHRNSGTLLHIQYGTHFTDIFIEDLDFFYVFFIQHCFICRPSNSIVSEDAGIEPRTYATLALTH